MSSKDEWITHRMQTTDWHTMGYWASAGKGAVWVDRAPGAGIEVAQGLLMFIGVIAVLSESTLGVAFLAALALGMQVLKTRARKKYLARLYDRTHQTTS
jgi:hypothetical protein